MHGSPRQTLKTTATLALLLIASTATAQVGTRIGNFMYRGNAMQLNGDTIDVSDSMVALSSIFWASDSSDTTIMSSETPSIFFVIDNSGSMSGRGATDPNGLRFSVTRAFLDTIYTLFPGAEVGLAVFGTYLWFDPNDSTAVTRYPYISKFPFKTVSPPIHSEYTDAGAYIPLVKLDSVYADYGGLTGLQLLDTILVTTGSSPNINLRYQPTNTALRGIYTNITTGFDAAQAAMRTATASRCSRYIIFLSDGAANRPGGNATYYFRDRVDSIPTTFTVFFPAGSVPTEIQTMTSNIRFNHYDTLNPPDSGCTQRSAYWASNSSDLAGTLSDNIWSIIRLPNQTRPTLITINTQLSTQRSGDSGFILNNFVPLIGEFTPCSLSIIYSVFQSGVKIRDTVISTSFNVHTMPHSNPAWNPAKSNYDVRTWDRDHVFRYGGAEIPEIIETMDSVELYFTFDSGSAHYGYDRVYIDLYNNIAPIDSQSIQLTRVSDRVFSGKFKRQVSATANRGEVPPLLQYRGNTDSIIAVFRNRENLTSGKFRLPLDTLRKAIGFVGVNLTMAVTDTTITAGDTTLPLRPSVTYSTGGAVPDTWVVPRLTWTQLPAVRTNDRIVAATGQYSRFTATVMDTLTPRQIQITLTLPNGATSSVIKNIFVRHASPHRLWIEADGTLDLYTPEPLNSIVFRSSDHYDTAWAVVRDTFNNLIGFSDPAAWVSRNPTVAGVATGPAGPWQGIVTKEALIDSTWVVAANSALSLSDSIPVIITDVAYDSVRILRNIAGSLIPVFELYDTIPTPVTLYVRAHREDGIGGPNSDGWVDIQGNWGTSLTGRTSTFAPTNANSWTFAPTDTGHGTIWVTVPGVSEMGLLDPVVFFAGAPNAMYIYPNAGAPTTCWPAAPAIADTMSADSSYSLLYAKLFYRTPLGKEIWLAQYDTVYTLSTQIRWSANGPRDTVTPDYGNHTTLVSRQARRATTVTATWNALSYSVRIYVVPGRPDHIVIEATPTVQNLIADDPLGLLTIGETDTMAFAYARIRDHHGNFVDASVHSQWSSTSTAVFDAAKGDSATGQGIAIRRCDEGQAYLIASDAAAWPGVTLLDTVLVSVTDITHPAVRIYVLTPSYDPYIDTVTIATDDSLTLYAEGQRSDDTTLWEPVDVYWGKDVSLITAANPPTQEVSSWTVVPAYIGTGRIWITRNEGYFTVTDTVQAVFVEGDPASIALYRSLGDPAAVPAFPPIDTVAAGLTDSLFAKIFDRNGEWLRRYEDSVALAQATISWAIQRVSGPGTDTALSPWTGRRTTFSPQTAFTTYRVTATFTDGALQFNASALIYVRPGTPNRLVIEGQVGPAVESSVDDNPLALVPLGPGDTIFTDVYAVIRDPFGNFCDYSHNPDWWSGDIAVVTATRGTQWAQYGQGRIDRVALDTGSAYVMVRDLTNGTLAIDSVFVQLTAVPYDSLRITLKDPVTFLDTVQIPGIYTMRSGDTTAFYVQARRDVLNTWENVNANTWQYLATLGSKSGPANTHVWNFGAVDTAHYGMITATFGSLSAAVTIEINAGDPASLVIYTDSLPPTAAGNGPKAGPPQFITVAAGAFDTMAALIFDNNGVFLPQYLGGAEGLSISWTATSRTFGDDLSARLLGAAGPVKYFSPTRAYDTVLVIASLTTATLTMRDSVLFVVRSSPVLHMVLENTPSPSLYVPDSCHVITIPATAQSGSAYGILRDPYNNRAYGSYYATIIGAAVVLSENDSFTVSIPLGNIGEVRVLRAGLSDTGQIEAWDSHNHDSCLVRLIQYYYDRLRIVDAAGIPYADGYTLTMTSDLDSTIYVQGRRSDNTTSWEDIAATWEVVPSLQPILAGSGRYSHSFPVSPTDTGSGWVRVTVGDDSRTSPDTLPLHFTAAPGYRLTITILTPPSQRIAGQPIVAVDSLYDRDNHLLRTSSLVVDPAAYHDTIGRGGTARPEPFMLVSGSTVYLDRTPWDAASQTFTNGVGTVTFTLYYAPAAPVSPDSMHRISVALTTGGTTLYAQTAPFTLLPAPLDSVVMEMNGAAIPEWDTVKIFFDSTQSSANLLSRGYDEFGNNLGFVPTDWSVNDSLHPIPVGTGDSVPSIDYSTGDPGFTGRDEAGWVFTRVPYNSSIVDSQYVFIYGPLIRLDSAVTGDTSGNGYLDRMTLYFSRPFTVPAGGGFTGLTITNQGTGHVFTVDGVLNTGSDSRVWMVTMHEDTALHAPQTGWTPEVQIAKQQNPEGRYIVDDTTLVSLDGAGPVVWTVDEYRYTNVSNDRTRDTVVVVFSEPVMRNNTFDALQQWDAPGSYFFVWGDDTASGGGTYIPRDYLLESSATGVIDKQQDPPANNATGTVVKFLMTNGQDLNGNHSFSIDTVTDFIVDAVTNRYNPPNDNNQKVRVNVHGEDGPAVVIPNPATSSTRWEGPGVFNVQDNPQAEDWTNPETGGGTAIEFNLENPEEGVNVWCQITIYDMVGNGVQSGLNEEFQNTIDRREDQADTAGLLRGNIYWNGTNAEGMAVAPGVYRAVIYLDYRDAVQGSGLSVKYSDKRKIVKIGIRSR